MALRGKNEHRFGFTTRKLDSLKQQRSSGKLVLGLSSYDGGPGENTTSDLKNALENSPAHNTVGMEEPESNMTMSNAVNSDGNDKYVWNKMNNTVFREDRPVSDSKKTQANYTKTFPLIREKTVSIPRTKLIDDLQTVVMKSTQMYKSPETSLVNDIYPSTLHTSDLIRTAYQVCNGDKDAMEISIESPRGLHMTTLPKTKRLKRKPIRRRWTQNPTKAPSTDVTDINVCGVSDFASACTKDDLTKAPCGNEHRQFVKRLPQMDDKTPSGALERVDSHNQIARNSLLRKSWRLAISRASPANVDGSGVFVSGVNIHPVNQYTGDTRRSSPQTIEQDMNRSEETKPPELMKLSFPVFQKSSNRRSPLLVWDEHQQMVAMGRPKSVNERSFPETIKRSKTLNRIELRKAPLESVCTSLSLPVELSRSHDGVLSDQPTTDNKHDSLRNSLPGLNQNRKTLLQPIVNIGSQSRTPSRGQSSAMSLQGSPKALVEPILRLSDTSSKMQGPSSNMLNFKSNFRPDLSVQKAEKGARFRVCKPMFDTEDYEDFQHKKYKKNTLKYKRSRDKAEGVHFLRVKIGEF